MNIKVGLLSREEKKRFRVQVCQQDPIWDKYLTFKRSNKKTAVKVVPFLLWLTKAMSRDTVKEPVTPTEWREMRLAEMREETGESLTKYYMLSYMEWLRHTCKLCGGWIEGDPLAPENMPIMQCTHEGCTGRNTAAGTRNTVLMNVRGYLGAVIDSDGASPFRKGENFPEYGANLKSKTVITTELYEHMLGVANDKERMILIFLRQTGMSKDVLYLKVTSDLMEQLGQDPLPDVILFPWKRTKTMGKDATYPRYAGICGDGVRILNSWVEYKALKAGDWLFPGQNGRPLSKSALSENFKHVVQKLGIQIPETERLSPHVLRGAAFTDLSHVADHDFAKYMTGKKVGIEILTYYNGNLDDIKESLRKAIPRMNPLEKVRIENLTLKERLDALEVENQEIKQEFKGLTSMVHDLFNRVIMSENSTPADALKNEVRLQ